MTLNSRRQFILLAAGSIAAGNILTSAVVAADAEKPAKDKAADAEPAADVVVDEKSDGKTVKAKVGDIIEFRLKGEKERTGWGNGITNHIGAKQKPPVLERGKESFEADPNPKEIAIGTYIFRAKAYEAGSVPLLFRYVYPGGHGHELEPRLATQVVREFKVTVEVN